MREPSRSDRQPSDRRKEASSMKQKLKEYLDTVFADAEARAPRQSETF